MRPPSFGPEAWGPLAAGWRAFHEGDRSAVLSVHADEGEVEPLPVSVFFRSEGTLRPADEVALSSVRGRVLDVGAGVGALTLILQERGFAVTALEVVPEGVALMRARGVDRVLEGRLESLPQEGVFDTILLLMNGSTLAGTLGAFPDFLATLQGLLAPSGQVLMDSTDLTPSGTSRNGGERDGGPLDFSEDGYPGELQYQLEFGGITGAPFPQLFLDPGTLKRVGARSGWKVELLWEDEGEFLAKLSREG